MHLPQRLNNYSLKETFDVIYAEVVFNTIRSNVHYSCHEIQNLNNQKMGTHLQPLKFERVYMHL
jgi:hypothetical protein